MEGILDLSLAEAVACAQNPFPIVVRSRKECGMKGSGYVAALTTTFSLFKIVPQPPRVILNVLGTELSSSGPLTAGSIAPVTEEDWPKMKDLLSKQKLLEIFGFHIDTPYDRMMANGFQCLLDNIKTFEQVSFPLVFPHGKGTFREKRRTPLVFPEYYRHVSRRIAFNLNSCENWLVWCELIEAAALIVERKVRDGTLPNERRHFSFLQSCCAVCGPKDEIKRCSRCHVMGYCSREHQIDDFKEHKKQCKHYQMPGDPL